VGNCSFCGKPAGLFRKQHPQCVALRDAGWTEMVEISKQAAVGRGSVDNLEGRLVTKARASFVPETGVRTAQVAGWEAAVDHLLEDGSLDKQEEAALVAFQRRFSLSQDDLDRRGAYSRVLKGAIIRDLLEGKIPQRVTVSSQLPFNFQKNEQLIYLFPTVEYLEDRTRTQYFGGYQGVSVRVMKGVYYRVGGFRGNPVGRTERLHVDSGPLAVTTKHLYFGGPRKSFRVRHDKIVTFIPYTDGVGIIRDAATAKPQVFVTGDGWFAYNLLANVSQLGAGV